MKKQLSLAMAGVMALSLAACGGSSASVAALDVVSVQLDFLQSAGLTFSTRLLPLPSLRTLP